MRGLSTVSVFAGAAVLAAAIAVVPAEAKKNEQKTASETAHPNDPMMVIISLRNQKASIYRGMSLITSTRVSTGKRGYATKAGVYSILEKRRRHYSNLYAGAPMPYMQRMTWSGTALHAGVVPGYPASHGCIRLPHSFAPKLFSMTNVGEQVVVAHGSVKPRRFEHPALFQPLPPPMPPSVVKHEDEQPRLMRKSSNAPAPSSSPRLPIVLAKASGVTAQDVKAAVLERPALQPRLAPTEVEQTTTPFAVNANPEERTPRERLASLLDDTTAHAIDPTAAPFDSDGAQVFAARAPQAQPANPSSAGSSQPARTAALSPRSVQAEPSRNEAGEPQAGPILTVSALALPVQQKEPVLVSLAVVGFNAHPPLPPAKPSVMLAKLTAGTAAAAIEAAEPHSPEPLRILVTRRTKRDRLIDVQYTLSAMGYLKPRNFDGTFGRVTISAIKAFQKDNDMPPSGAFTKEIEKKIYDVAGKEMPPQGHLFVRQKFQSVFDLPVRFANPDKPLGTHVFTVLHFERGATRAEWTALSLNDKEDAATVLNRIEIPDHVRQNLSERLTPGSALIVADTAINSANLPKGADFLVWDTSQKAHVHRASVRPKPRRKRRVTTRRRPTTSYSRRYRSRNPWRF